MSLDTNAQIAHDVMVSLGNAYTALNAQMTEALTTLNSIGATNSKAKVQALKNAAAVAGQAVVDASTTYDEAGSL